MKKLLLTIISILILVTCSFSATETVGETSGQYFDTIHAKYFPTTLKVYVDDLGIIYINTPKLNNASYYFEGEEFSKFTNFIVKGVEWGETARQRSLALTKVIGKLEKKHRNMDELFDIYAIVTFYSSEKPKGRRQELILEIKGFKHSKASSKIYINLIRAGELLDILRKAPAVSKRFRQDQEIINKEFK
ncbi:MAG: hypothetical protein KKH98_00250 [Spirochaetes bacterium]|nr:hypothetical protein [Spirochaetota bacterium]